MSIRTRLDDAHFLLTHGRDDGALLSVCAAISATSRKRYPRRGTPSDREAFTTFLGEEIRVVTRGAVANVFMRYPGADQIKYPEEIMPLQDVLYEFVRCTLAHEGRIGENVEFTKADELVFEIKEGRLILGGGIIRGLLAVVEYAPENAPDFPEVARLPADVLAWYLFDIRRDKLGDYLEARRKRVVGMSSPSP